MVLQMISDKPRALIIFARTPATGTVKKRLAQTIGEQPALHCYNLLLKKIVAHSTEVAADRFLYFHPRIIKTLPGASRPLDFDFTLRRQNPGPDLGAKMEAAFTETLEKDNFSATVLIGADIPFLNAKIIEQAFSKLASSDIVLGPAVDGGYYLIGLRHQTLNREQIFRDIPWGTDQVLKTTLNRAGGAKLKVSTLTPLFDVDTIADLKHWQQQEKNPAIAQKLSEILQNHP